MRATWIEGEIMHGWQADDYSLKAAGIARYVEGWGTQLDQSVVSALVPGAPDHPREGDAVEFSAADVQRVAALLREQAAKRMAPRVRLVRCDCGHTIPSAWVMSTSSGTSCDRCYDRMSG